MSSATTPPNLNAATAMQPASASMNAPNDSYRLYRDFTTRSETMLELILGYFQERYSIENQYAASLDKLSNKTMTEIAGLSSSLNTSTVKEAWQQIGKCTSTLTSEQTKLSRLLDNIVDDLNKEQHAQHKALKALRASVKNIHRDYGELRTHALPKAKTTYYKKCEQLEKEPKETLAATTSSKYLKLAKEVSLADQAYRSSIHYLEASRDRLHETRERTQTESERIERSKIRAVKAALARYCDAESILCQKRSQEIETLRLYIECIKEDVDVSLHRQEFQVAWPEPDRMYYENFKTKTAAKNLVFGMPLEIALRQDGVTDAGIPLVLAKCFEAIEARGLDREGIYRVSGKITEMNDLRLQLETDASAVNLLDERCDVNVIAGLVKQYFRELPQPVFYFPPKERAEYALIADTRERISRLRARIKTLSRPNQVLLRALIAHLKRVVDNSGKNKMVASNLGLLFGPIVFQGQLEFADAMSSSSSGSVGSTATSLGPSASAHGAVSASNANGANSNGPSHWLKPFATMASAAAAAISNATNNNSSAASVPAQQISISAPSNAKSAAASQHGSPNVAATTLALPPLPTTGSPGRLSVGSHAAVPPPDLSSSKLAMDFSRFEYLKTDVVLEDLLMYMDELFLAETQPRPLRMHAASEGAQHVLEHLSLDSLGSLSRSSGSLKQPAEDFRPFDSGRSVQAADESRAVDAEAASGAHRGDSGAGPNADEFHASSQ